MDVGLAPTGAERRSNLQVRIIRDAKYRNTRIIPGIPVFLRPREGAQRPADVGLAPTGAERRLNLQVHIIRDAKSRNTRIIPGIPVFLRPREDLNLRPLA